MATILPFTFPPSSRTLELANTCIQSGGVLAIPTDSYYALAVGAFQKTGLEKLQRIKQDREHKPFPLLIGDLSQLDLLAANVPEIAQQLIRQFWPGLLTLVLPVKPQISGLLISDVGTVGVRQPHDLGVCKLLTQTGPLTGTSANRSGQSPAQSAEDVRHQLEGDLDLILDGGPTPGGEPSTVLQIYQEYRILRQGAIARAAIQDVLGKIPLSD